MAPAPPLDPAPREASSAPKPPEPEPARPSIFFSKLERDVWEAWVWSAVGLFFSAAVIWAVAYLRLGYPSLYAYGVGIPLTLLFAAPIMLWGLIKTLLNPPVMRTSRSIGFVALLLVALAANSPLFIAPVSTESFVSQHAYSLPFEGDWYTYSGGREREHNALVTAPAMRFAYDFTRLTQDGELFSGDDKLLESYPCYGSEVLAPVGGSVVAVHASQADNVPGQPSQQNLLGNHVVLQIDDQEYFIAAFLKQRSTPQRVGDRVERGEVIGACGNSGGSTTPQLRVYLVKQGDKLILTEGLPMPFAQYEVVAGPGAPRRVTSGMPLGAGDHDDLKGGQTVRPIRP